MPPITVGTKARDARLKPAAPKGGSRVISVRRVVDRLTFGYTQAEAALLAQLGQDGYIEHHLRPSQIAEDPALDAFLAANYPTLTQSAKDIAATSSDGANQLTRARLMRAVFSRRQLFERVVEMWTDHFNIDLDADSQNVFKPVDDRDVVRANALGTFASLLSASAHSPSMLLYLNNDQNKVGKPNENYAREIMELHTLGVDGGYTQADVQQVAKCFTGWGIDTTSTSPTYYQFKFTSTSHDTSQKVVLGNIIPARTGNSGLQDGVDVLNILTNHPSTRSFIAKKMLRTFVSDAPTAQQIADVAEVYRTTNGDLTAMMRAVLKEAVKYPYSLKLKRPTHLLASMLRALGAIITSPNNLQTPLTEAGNLPFRWDTPDGYPDVAAAWTGLMLPRWNFGARLMSTANSNNGDWWNTTTQLGIRVDEAALLSGATTAQTIADRLNQAVYAGSLPQADVDRIKSYLGTTTPTQQTKREAIGLAVSLPTFQWF
jgi:hypothetical protein